MRISLEKPLDDYKHLIQEMLKKDGGDEETIKTFNEIGEEARNATWKLLFEQAQQPTSDAQHKASELLLEYKMDACFYSPWEYNKWVVNLRDELLKREMLDFWRQEVVAKSLGPCWARDSDLFDDSEDPEPANFYKHAGCVAPWIQNAEGGATSSATTAATGPDLPDVMRPKSGEAKEGKVDFSKEKISLEDPVKDFKSLMEKYLNQPNLSDDDSQSDFACISGIARNAVWELLFADPQPPTKDRQDKAGDLLQEYRMEAAFYNPFVYNEWIVKVRDLVLQKEILYFWRDHIVKRELGLCWYRDSDYFDNMYDPAPPAFYRHAGCVAPFDEEGQNASNELSASKKEE